MVPVHKGVTGPFKAVGCYSLKRREKAPSATVFEALFWEMISTLALAQKCIGVYSGSVG